MRTCSPAFDHNDLVFSLFMFDRLWFQEIVLLTFCPDLRNPMKGLRAVFSRLVT